MRAKPKWGLGTLIIVRQADHELFTWCVQTTTIGHLRQSMGRIMPKVNDGKELGHELGIKVFIEGDDPLDVQLLTPLQSIPKVWQVLLHVCEIDRLDLHKQVLLLLQDIVIDGLLKPVPERTPLKSRVLIHMVGRYRTPLQTSD